MRLEPEAEKGKTVALLPVAHCTMCVAVSCRVLHVAATRVKFEASAKARRSFSGRVGVEQQGLEHTGTKLEHMARASHARPGLEDPSSSHKNGRNLPITSQPIFSHRWYKARPPHRSSSKSHVALACFMISCCSVELEPMSSSRPKTEVHSPHEMRWDQWPGSGGLCMRNCAAGLTWAAHAATMASETTAERTFFMEEGRCKYGRGLCV